jgi:hypothetical protein
MWMRSSHVDEIWLCGGDLAMWTRSSLDESYPCGRDLALWMRSSNVDEI